MEAWRPPQRIGRHYPLDQPENLDRGRRSAAASAVCPGQARPELAKALPLPPHHGVGLNVVQRAAPAVPYSRQTNPEQSVEGRQKRPPSLPLERGELHPKRGILEGNGVVTAQQEADESNKAQQEARHLRRLFASIASKVKWLRADGIMATHRAPTTKSSVPDREFRPSKFVPA